jgi:indole-3-glycerol phosphate synthase
VNILQRIVKSIQKDLVLKKEIIPIQSLESSVLFDRQTISLSKSILNSQGVIAEHKRRSPSKPEINFGLSVAEVAQGYASAGAAGMSVLTNNQYFGGSLEDLQLARQACSIPLLRKEFIVDEYQVLEAKANGADAILLIAACLEQQQIKTLSELAKQLGLEVLLEVHNAHELAQSLMPSLDMIGVNNRDLTSFEVNLETSMSLVDHIPSTFVKLSESGLSSIADVIHLRDGGYDGFLMGEHFMKTDHPGSSAKKFIQSLNK